MSDPRRLTEADELARVLLGSASDDMPSVEGRARARQAALSAVAVGLGAGAAVSLAAGGVKAAGKVSSTIVLKWLALISIPVALGVGAAVALVGTRQPSIQQPAVAPLAPALTERRPLPAPPAADATANLEPVSPEVAPQIRPRATTSAASASPAPSLQAEITQLDAARHALARGDGSVLDRYLAEYPRGALREQALWMKISNLEQLGRKSEARALAKRLVASHPNGTFAARARALLQP